MSSKIETLCQNVVTAAGGAGGGVSYLTPVADPFAPFAPGQVRAVGDAKKVMDFSLLLPTSVLISLAGEITTSGGPVDVGGSTITTALDWDFHLAVKNYAAAADGKAALYQLHDDLFDAIHGFPIATGLAQMTRTKLFFQDLRPYTETANAIIWRARYRSAYVRQGTRVG